MTRNQLTIKSLFDRVAAAGLLVAVSPLFLLATIIIKWFSRGPIFFVQNRVGLHEEEFPIYKFRTMHVIQPQDRGNGVTLRDDPRLFPGAKWMRKWKIDELPQLMNILNGSMSLIGPRPTVMQDYDRMTAEQRKRATVKPGLTGLAQVMGGTAMFWPDRIKLDLQYIEHYSIWLDLKILFWTAYVVLTGRADTYPPGDDEWGLSDGQSRLDNADNTTSDSATREETIAA